LRVKVICSSPAILCALMIPLCALVIRPVAELGIDDDWGYIKNAQVMGSDWSCCLQRCGDTHAGLGALPGGNLRKTVWLLLRGRSVIHGPYCNPDCFPNATDLGACRYSRVERNHRHPYVVLSPLFLPLAFRFVTDMAGLFCVVLCLYACLRALQARTDRSALAWICFATLSNAASNSAGGTVRQIAWLGALVMVPSALWLMRRRQHFLLVGGLASIASIIIIFASLRRFHHRPYRC
jgi:hypothetical protein